MNARQKAKKYKKLAQELEEKAVLYDCMQRALYFKSLREKRDIQTCKFRICVPYIPVVTNTDDDFIYSLYRHARENAKSQLAKEIANYLIDNNLIDLECDKDDIQRANIYTATLNVVRKEDVQYAERRDTITG